MSSRICMYGGLRTDDQTRATLAGLKKPCYLSSIWSWCPEKCSHTVTNDHERPLWAPGIVHIRNAGKRATVTAACVQ